MVQAITVQNMGKKNAENEGMDEEYFYRKHCKNATAMREKYIAHCTIT